MKNKRGLVDTILIALTIALITIGVHQTLTIGKVEGYGMGFFKSYWIFMFALLLILIRQVRKNKAHQNNSKK